MVAIGITAPVIVRTAREIEATLRLKPAAADDLETGKQHLVGFFEREPTLDPDLSRYAPEAATRVGRDLLHPPPNGACSDGLAV